MIKKWQIVKQETIFKDSFGKELRETVFKNPYTGREEKYNLFGQKDWSSIFGITKNNLVITVIEFNQGSNKDIHHLPGGTINFTKETPMETAKRELIEETGYRAKKIIFLKPALWLCCRNSWTKGFLFLALDCKKIKKASFDEKEPIKTKLVPLRKWINMVGTEIEDPYAIAATFRALLYL